MTSINLPEPIVPLDMAVRGLGWFSIGLGLAELLAPRQVSRTSGMVEHSGILRGYGLREIGAGLGLLLSNNPRPWLWGRVAGDALDVTTVMTSANPRRPLRLSLSLIALLGVGLADLYYAMEADKEYPNW